MKTKLKTESATDSASDATVEVKLTRRCEAEEDWSRDRDGGHSKGGDGILERDSCRFKADVAMIRFWWEIFVSKWFEALVINLVLQHVSSSQGWQLKSIKIVFFSLNCDTFIMFNRLCGRSTCYNDCLSVPSIILQYTELLSFLLLHTLSIDPYFADLENARMNEYGPCSKEKRKEDWRKYFFMILSLLFCIPAFCLTLLLASRS